MAASAALPTAPDMDAAQQARVTASPPPSASDASRTDERRTKYRARRSASSSSGHHSPALLALLWSVALLATRRNGTPLSEALATPLVPRPSRSAASSPSSSGTAARGARGSLWPLLRRQPGHPNLFSPSLGRLRGGADAARVTAPSPRGGAAATTQCNVLKSHDVTSGLDGRENDEQKKKKTGQHRPGGGRGANGASEPGTAGLGSAASRLGEDHSHLLQALGLTTDAADLGETTDDFLDEDELQAEQEANKVIPCEYVAETNLPTDVGQFRLRAYRVSDRSFHSRSRRNRYVGTEPCVIYAADKPPFGIKGGNDGGTVVQGARAVPVRIHDQCFTSEVFRSQRCDCKEQLKMSLEYIKKHGGAIIYLQQEGRGIGLANKVAAYALQDVGMDTVDANIHLGFPEDCRQYGVVPSILSEMGIDSIRLMTNNPRKLERLRDLGVDIAGTIPMVVKQANPYNRKYLETKRERMNHKNFGAILSSDAGSVFSSPPQQPNGTGTFGATPAKRVAVAEKYINEGEEMAAAAIAAALRDEEKLMQLAGVTASSDGYCFGRESVEEAIAAIGRGELVVVVDDMDRENEGDFIMAADLCTPETMATIVRYSSGVICVGMEGRRMDELCLPAMVTNNEDPKGTAFSVTVDAAKKHGITTGISAADRAKTMQLLASTETTADDFVRPGHIFPLRAKDGGVLERDGHTEAAVDLCRLAGRHSSGVLCEIVSEEDPVNMARLPELRRFCKKHGYVLTSIVDIAQYRRDTEE